MNFDPLMLVALYPAFWYGLLYVVSRFSPWRVLAEKFPGGDDHIGRKYWFVSLNFGALSYGNCVYAWATPDQLTLTIMLPFRPFHPPITLPREAVAILSTGRNWWRGKWAKLDVEGTTLTIRGQVTTSEFFESPVLVC